MKQISSSVCQSSLIDMITDYWKNRLCSVKSKMAACMQVMAGVSIRARCFFAIVFSSSRFSTQRMISSSRILSFQQKYQLEAAQRHKFICFLILSFFEILGYDIFSLVRKNTRILDNINLKKICIRNRN